MRGPYSVRTASAASALRPQRTRFARLPRAWPNHFPWGECWRSLTIIRGPHHPSSARRLRFHHTAGRVDCAYSGVALRHGRAWERGRH